MSMPSISIVKALLLLNTGILPLTNLTNLQGWYNAAHWLYNIDSCLASFSNSACSEWDMDIDTISVNALSREERECHVQNNLCFICHKDGHMSKECLDRKHYKGGSSKGKYKGKIQERKAIHERTPYSSHRNGWQF